MMLILLKAFFVIGILMRPLPCMLSLFLLWHREIQEGPCPAGMRRCGTWWASPAGAKGAPAPGSRESIPKLPTIQTGFWKKLLHSMSITDSLKVLLWNNNPQSNGIKCIGAFSMVF